VIFGLQRNVYRVGYHIAHLTIVNSHKFPSSYRVKTKRLNSTLFPNVKLYFQQN